MRAGVIKENERRNRARGNRQGKHHFVIVLNKYVTYAQLKKKKRYSIYKLDRFYYQFYFLIRFKECENKIAYNFTSHFKHIYLCVTEIRDLETENRITL